MILWARSTSRSSEQSMKYKSNSENMRKFCSFYSQNSKIVLIIKHGRHFFEIHQVRKGLWAFFLDVLFGRWLAEQANSDHVVTSWTNEPFLFAQPSPQRNNKRTNKIKHERAIKRSFWSEILKRVQRDMKYVSFSPPPPFLFFLKQEIWFKDVCNKTIRGQETSANASVSNSYSWFKMQHSIFNVFILF